MRTWLPILVFFAVFLGVYAWRQTSSRPVQATRAPFPGAELLAGALLPGSQVTARLVRGGLLVDGDLADPLQEIDVLRAGTPDEKVAFSGGWTSPIRALWFFDADPAAKYRVNIHTRHRSMAEVLQAGKIEPLELQRVRVRVKTAAGSGTPVIAQFSPDGAWLAVGTNGGDLKLVATPGDQTRIDLHELGAISRLLFSADSKTLFAYATSIPNAPRAYDVATGKETVGGSAPPKDSPAPSTTDALAKSDDGRWVVKPGAASGSMALFDSRSESTKPVYAIAHPLSALSADGRYVAVIDERNLATEPEEADVEVIVEH